jgi:hypothetical protein
MLVGMFSSSTMMSMSLAANLGTEVKPVCSIDTLAMCVMADQMMSAT